MSDAKPARAPLSANEYAFLGCTILFWSAFVVLLGKDTSWDFRNYHWYGPYALFNHRLGFDVAVAHLASWYNPYVDVPFYLLATHTHSWIVMACLGLVQGANVVPLYLMGREALRHLPDYRLGAGALALLGQTGAMTLTEFGTNFYDNVLSIFILGGLAILVIRRETLRHGPLGQTALIAGGAGLITGMAMGLKLPEMPFCLGFAAALLALGGSWKNILVRLLAGGLGGAVGCALFAAPWMWFIYQQTGNPLFPYFNDYWKSPLALAAPYRDLRFVPTHFWRQLFFPFLFSVDWHVADDMGFQDIRIAIAYLLVPAGALIWLSRRQNRDPIIAADIALPLFAFAAASYLEWLRTFAIYRYILLLEMLSPLLIVGAVGVMPGSRKARYIALGAICCAVLVTSRSDFIEHAPLDDPYVQVAVPPIPHPDHTMVIMTGDSPMGFIATQLPPQIPVLRIDGFTVQPRDGTLLTRQMKDRVGAQLASGGEVYLIADATDMTRARSAVRDYQLAIRWPECQQFDTNLSGTYEWCPVSRVP